MPNYGGIQHKIDRGLGIASQKLGVPHSAYRIEANSSGDFPNNWTLFKTSVLILKRKETDRWLESALQATGTFWMSLVFDAEPYLVGDVFVQTDPAYVPGKSYGPGATLVLGQTLQFEGAALAWHPAVHKPIGARIDRRGQIFRPASGVSTMSDGTTRWNMTENDALPLQLVNGSFVWGTAGTAASYVPMGMGSTDRPPRGQNFPPATPGVTPVVRWYAYVPYLLGYEPSEGDMLRLEDGSRYTVINPWSQEAGSMGMQLFLERLVSQDR